VCSLCNAGTFGNTSALTNANCTGICQPGHACPAGAVVATQVVCPAGRYSFARAGDCIDCPIGRYGATDRMPLATCTALCAPGSFGSAPALTVPTCSGNCTAGYICAAGSTNSTPTPCQPGQYSDTGAAQCSMCPAGRYGATAALNSSACTAPCPAGYACPTGAFNGTALVCPPGQYAEEGWGACQSCPAGQFGQVPALTTAGCSGGCTAGYYCPSGSASMVPCEAGLWSADARRGAPCVSNCTAGYFCPSGSSSPTQFACGSVAAYCPAGSGSPRDVDPGYYSAGGATVLVQTQQLLCPEPWSSVNNGLSVYCDGNGIFQDCPAGVYGSTGGLNSSSCSGGCQEGYYCPKGSWNATAVPCGDASKCVSWRVFVVIGQYLVSNHHSVRVRGRIPLFLY
jgi:hypothetical protein